MTRSKRIKRIYYTRIHMRRAGNWFIVLAALLLVIVFMVGVIRFFSRGGRPSPKLEDIGAFRIPYETYSQLESLSIKYQMPFADLLTVCLQDNLFFPDKVTAPAEDEIERRYVTDFNKTKRLAGDKNTAAYETMFGNILSEMRAFPIPAEYGPDTYVFSDSWGAARSYGGERVHEGTDILDRDNIRGRLPVVSMTDGRVFNSGWNDLGGYYVGVTAKNGTYYYYAHLDHFSPELVKGSPVKIGQLIGYMGDTGYGPEGTKGKFPVHLHVGVCPSVTFTKNEFWINPYPFLRSLEEQRISSAIARR